MSSKIICPNCGGEYKKQNTVDRHLKFGCPSKTDEKIDSKPKEKVILDIPDFDNILGEEPEISDDVIDDFIRGIEVEDDGEGNPQIHISEIINNTTFLENALATADEKMFEIYYNRTGEPIWNPSKRAVERGIFIWLLKINIRSTALAISPVYALIGFTGYFYVIPAFKLLKSKKGDINEQRERRKENEENRDE